MIDMLCVMTTQKIHIKIFKTSILFYSLYVCYF